MSFGKTPETIPAPPPAAPKAAPTIVTGESDLLLDKDKKKKRTDVQTLTTPLVAPSTTSGLAIPKD